jgi:DHA2 family multidrug resistance protein
MPPAPSPSGRRLATCGLMIATAMQAADALIANVALPQLQSDLGGGIELGAWVMTSYLCATAVFAPLTGWLRRRYGPRQLFHGAIGVFIAASLLCAAAPSGAAIILFRILQGAGGGIILPLAQAILLDLYPKERHGRMLAIWGAALMVGPILGPPIGGIITDLASWRWVFAINLPIGLLAIWATSRLRPQAEPSEAVAIDGVGIVLLMIAVGALQLTLERGVGRSWLHSPELIGEASITILAVTAMAVRARHSGFGVFRLDVFKDINFAVAAFYNFMTSGLLFVAVVFLPALGEGPLGYSATLAGSTIVPRAVLMMLMMLITGRLIGKINYRILLAGGWILMASGLALLSAIPAENALFVLVAGSTVQAVGAGLLFTPLSTLAFSTLPPGRRTDAAGVYSLLRQLGFASGTALMTAVLGAKMGTYLADLTAQFAAAGGPIPAQRIDAANLRAYAECFRLMAVAALIVAPGILFFRLEAAASAVKKAA